MSLELHTHKKIKSKRVVSNKTSSTSLIEKIYEFGKRDIKFKSSKEKQKERFFSEIGILLSAGVDLQTGLKLSYHNTKKNALNDIYNKVLEQIQNGKGLAQAMKSTKQFNDFDCFSVLIGENTGELSRVFSRLSTYYNKKMAQKRKIINSLNYPLIVLITTIGAMYFMLKFVVPMFSDTLLKFGGDLPALTKIIIGLSNHITTYFLLFTSALLILAYTYNKNKHKEHVKKVISSLILRIPYFGNFVSKTYLLQFAQSMELLLSSKVNIVECIELTQKMIRFYPLNTALKQMHEGILKGEFFYKSMEKQSFFNQSMVTLVKIGEEVNQLEKIFAQLSKQYESDMEYQSNLLITILEPIVLLLLAALVAVILIAMYLPMFKIGSVVH